SSELAFLGLGLLLGAASGAALIVVLGSRSPRREIRVTVTRDVLPRRSETLSQDAFVASPSAPAPSAPRSTRDGPRASNLIERPFHLAPATRPRWPWPRERSETRRSMRPRPSN